MAGCFCIAPVKPLWALALTAGVLCDSSGRVSGIDRASATSKLVWRALLNWTITFQRVEMIKSDTNWLAKPPEVVWVFRSSVALTPAGGSFRRRSKKASGQQFDLIFSSQSLKKWRSTPDKSRSKPETLAILAIIVWAQKRPRSDDRGQSGSNFLVLLALAAWCCRKYGWLRQIPCCF